MAQRNSRKYKGRRPNRPELRTGGGRQARAARSRDRNAAVARSSATGPGVRMRPAGIGGLLLVYVIGWIAALAVALLGLRLGQWNEVGYADSLWLYLAFGATAAAPAVGRVSRSSTDADVWALQALLVPTFAFIVEVLVGPSCPRGASCDALGARGSIGVLGSVLLIVVLAVVAFGLARWMYRAAADRRPASGRVTLALATSGMLLLLLFPGTIIAAALVGTDAFVRSDPQLAETARDEVAQECFGLDDAPAFDVRPAPVGYNSGWTTYAVRRASESRKDIGGKKSLSKDWLGLDRVHPYEATASFNEKGDPVDVTCRRISAAAGAATKDDLVEEEPESNPLSPKSIGSNFYPRFFTQGQAGPTEEAVKKAADDKKAAAAAKAAAAKKSAADAKKSDSDDAAK